MTMVKVAGIRKREDRMTEKEMERQINRWRDRWTQIKRKGQMVRQNTPPIINLWGKISKIAVTLKIMQMFEKLCVKQFGRWYTVNSECFCVCIYKSGLFDCQCLVLTEYLRCLCYNFI